LALTLKTVPEMPVPQNQSACDSRRSLWSLTFLKPLGSTLLLIASAVYANSQSIGSWTFNNTLAGTGGTNTTVSAAGFGPDIPTVAFSSGAEYYGENGWPATGTLNTNSYLQFSISPNTGYELNLTDLTLRIRRSTTGGPSGSGPTQWSLRSSLDGYTSDIASGSLSQLYNNFNIALPGYLNLNTTVTFRLYGYNVAIAPGGLSRLVADYISIQGISSVLPMRLSDFTAELNKEKSINVNWQMNNVAKGSRFNVQRSVNGVDFSTINSFTEANDQLSGTYNYTDADFAAVEDQLFYRIKVSEPTGWTYFTPVVKVSTKTVPKTLFNYTSLQGQSLIASLQVPENAAYTVMLIASNGMVVQKRAADLRTGANVLKLELSNLAHGTYSISVFNKQAGVSKQFIF
jgi:hypothetical protein